MSGANEVYEVEIRVQIQGKYESGGYSNNRLNTSETFQIPLGGFTDIAAVLGRFHDLAKGIQNDGPWATR